MQQYFALVQQGLLFEHYFSFWYDSVSGAYGPWGGGIDDLVTPGLVLCGPLPVNASNGTTGVYINGRQLPHSEWSIFHQALPGGLPQGYYWLDGQANMGRQGQSAFTNLSMQGEWYADEW